MTDTRVTRRMIERRRRGIFGWFFLLLFWAFNLFMAAAVYRGMSAVEEQGANLASDAERAGHAIGMAMGLSMMLGFWAVGVIILGTLAYFTRGRTEMIELTDRS